MCGEDQSSNRLQSETLAEKLRRKWEKEAEENFNKKVGRLGFETVSEEEEDDRIVLQLLHRCTLIIAIFTEYLLLPCPY